MTYRVLRAGGTLGLLEYDSASNAFNVPRDSNPARELSVHPQAVRADGDRARFVAFGTVCGLAKAIDPEVGVGAESLRRWVLQAQVDGAQRPGVTTAERQRIRDLEREVRDLKEANEILKAASIFFARDIGPRHC